MPLAQKTLAGLKGLFGFEIDNLVGPILAGKKVLAGILWG